ncbi:energy transducer TonB [Paraliomyxa miuraensis]|uniref:energy transducer TonB n=1 Tax=Paraliomyxa miuraensis TaxID=376150 RepID=UPI00224E78B0|nr:energy transducer TonB [Paraliomyxa miuraensis]MCX4241470.1 energy transducer TonB [Paraliomyxa miuraensis]
MLAAPPEGASAAPTGELRPPLLENTTSLDYPADLAGRPDPPAGDVIIELTIGTDGVPKDLTVVQPLHPTLDQLALEAVGRLRYTPATLDGQPVEVVQRLTIPIAPPPPPEPEAEPATEPAAETEPEPDSGAAAEVDPDAATTEGGDADEQAGPVRIAGTVLEAGQRTPIPGARVVAIPAAADEDFGQVRKTRYDPPGIPAWQASATTDPEGNFELRGIPGGGKIRVIVLAQGYERIEFVEGLPANEAITVKYFAPRLETNPYRTVVVTEGAGREEVARRTITADEIRVLPGTQGDALKSIQNFPGVARAPFGIGLLAIRGTGPNDSAVYLGHHEIPTLFHFGGLTSVFNGDILDKIDFVPGNFDSRYGDAIGGIIDVTPRAGRRDGYHGYIDSDVFDTGVLVEGPVGKGSFALSGRRSYIDVLLPAFIPDDAGLDLTIAPRYYDYQTLFDYPLAGGTFTARIFGSDDRTKVVAANPNEVEPDERDAFETAQFFHRFDLAYEKKSGPWRFLVTPSYRLEYIQFGIGQFFDFDLRTHNVSLRSEVERTLGRRSGLRVGTEYVGTWFQVDVEAPPIPTGGGGSSSGSLTTTVKSAAAVPAVYSTATLGVTDTFTLFPGVRMGYYTRPDPTSFVDPRMNFAWQLADRTLLKGGTGIYTQSPQAVEYSSEFGNPRLGVQRGLQNSVGVSQQFEYGINLDGTAFFNYIWDQSTGSSELVRREDGSIGPEVFANTQQGRTYGLEVLLRKQLTGRFFGWLAYTLSRSERRATPEDDWELFGFDQTHILTLIGVVKLPKGWQAGARFRLVSGNPMTPVVGAVYDGAGGFYVPLNGVTNSDRMPAFHQLDLRVDKQWTWKRASLTLYLDVQNVYNRQNTEFLIYSFDYSDRRPVAGLPIIPSLGLKLEF